MKKSSRSRKVRPRDPGVRRFPTTRRSAKTGLPPGTMIHVGETKTEETRVTVMEFAPDRVVEHSPANVEEALRFRGGPNPVWINVYGLHDVGTVERIGAHWGIEALTLEDIVNASQAPHVEFHDGYIFIVMKTIKFEPAEGHPRLKGCEEIPELDIDQISVIVGSDFVMCFHEEDTDRLESLCKRIRSGNAYESLKHTDYLAYAVIDMITDNSFAVLEALGDAIEGVEIELTGSPDGRTAARIHLYKRQLLQLRKAISPSRGLITKLMTENHNLISPSTLPFLRDVNDHVFQMVDMLDTQREILAGIQEVYLSGISTRMNEIMKMLTIISTIFIPLTFIVGIYGMNFRNMPELESVLGYPLVWVSFILVSGGLLLFFRRKKWI